MDVELSAPWEIGSDAKHASQASNAGNKDASLTMPGDEKEEMLEELDAYFLANQVAPESWPGTSGCTGLGEPLERSVKPVS